MRKKIFDGKNNLSSNRQKKNSTKTTKNHRNVSTQKFDLVDSNNNMVVVIQRTKLK